MQQSERKCSISEVHEIQVLKSCFPLDSVPIGRGFYGQGEGKVLLDDLLCQGDEENLLQCEKYSRGTHSCDHSEDAGVRCEGEFLNANVNAWA